MTSTLRIAFLATPLLAALTLITSNTLHASDGGLHTQDWFAVTFKDIAEDIEVANEEGKRLALVFEQAGCIYCKKMHEELLTDPEVKAYLEENFKIVQFNMFGDEEVTDLDGDAITEKQAARKWGYVFTPTIVFLPEDVPEATTVNEAAVAVMPGAFGKWTFLHMFQWVKEKGYDGDEHFQKYHARLITKLKVEGKI